MSDLRNKTINGIVWSALEQFSVQGIQFILGIILARILLPSDYGIIGMLAIFIAISQSLTNAGFSSALIQKMNPTNNDYSTVFYFNFAISIVIYIILFLCAPIIAKFYNTPILLDLTKIVGLNIIISSFSIVQIAKLSKKLDFKTQAKASLSSVIISGLIGIYLAYNGYGVWSLVVQSLVRNLINSAMLWIVSKWIPSWTFSISSLKGLFKFGSRLLYASLLSTVFDNLYTLVIGKFYKADELGFYTRANQFQQLPSQNITSIIQRVTFPVLSSIQDDQDHLTKSYRKIIRFSAFIVFPLMLLLAVISEPMIRLVLTDKWIQSASYLQILCFAGLLYPIHSINLNILKVKGYSGLFLKLEIYKKILVVIILLFTYSFGIKAMLLGQVLLSILALGLNTYYTSNFIDYKILTQFKDLLSIFILALIASFIVYILNLLINSDLLKIVISLTSGFIIYCLLAYIFKFQEIQEVKSIILLIKNKGFRKI